MQEKTFEQFDQVAATCRKVFTDKMHDYGTAWRILRATSMTDQIFIKANRIRSIQEKGESKVAEGITSELIGIFNYSVMALIQLELGSSDNLQMEPGEAARLYDKYVKQAKDLMTDKNHDYDEAWRQMRVSSLVDIILMKLLRVKQIEDNDGQTKISEGLEANYLDIINYSVFAMILMIQPE